MTSRILSRCIGEARAIVDERLAKEAAIRLLKFVGFVYLIGFLICLCVTLAGAQTQQRTFEDTMGRNTGRSVTDTRGNATFYDNMGRNTGRSTTSNGITTFYDNMGRQTGTIRSK
jgi:hypothetical protein